MRKHGYALAAMVLVSGSLFAQAPAGGGPVLPAPGAGGPGLVPVLNPTDRLDALLMAWEKRMTSVESIVAEKCVRTDKSKTGTKTYEGEARYLKPNLAALRLVRQDNPNVYELYVSTGNFLYEYRPDFKKLVIHELDQPKAGNFNNNFLQFLFGMTAVDAKRRYDLTLAKDVSQDNPHYVYINVRPRFEADKREFTRAQMVLFAETMLPRRLWFEAPNGVEVTWDLPNIDTTKKLTPAAFTPPAAPAGWETKREPRMDGGVAPAGAPRIVRPASK